MSNANIDQNDVKTWTAYNDTTGQIERVRFDPTLNVVHVFVVAPDANTPTTLNTAKIDANDTKTLMGWNDTTNKPEAIRCGVNGELLVISE